MGVGRYKAAFMADQHQIAEVFQIASGVNHDTVFSSFADVMLVIPSLAILITVSAYVRVVSVELMAVIVGLLAWPLPARVIRAQTLSLRQRLFVDVARLSGQNDFEIIIFQILPNLTAFLAATFVGAVSSGILASVGLEVLGLGPQNVPTIGRTLYYAFNYSNMIKTEKIGFFYKVLYNIKKLFYKIKF